MALKNALIMQNDNGTTTTAIQVDTANAVDTVLVISGASLFTGSMFMWPTATPPAGFLLCNGSTVSRSTYSALFSVLGGVFGNGDGSTTFTLPDYRDRMPIGAGTVYSAASTGGSKDAIVVSHTHTATSTVTDPGHVHRQKEIYQNGGGTNLPAGTDYGGDNNPYDGGVNVLSSVTGITVATTNTSTGSSGTNTNLPPYLGIYFIIKT